MPKPRGFKTYPVLLEKRGETILVPVSHALKSKVEMIVGDLSTFDGIKLLQFIEAVYDYGRKDGAREVFARLDESIAATKTAIPFQRPGRPAKRKKATTKKATAKKSAGPAKKKARKK